MNYKLETSRLYFSMCNEPMCYPGHCAILHEFPFFKGEPKGYFFPKTILCIMVGSHQIYITVKITDISLS